jgi:hypothetical protein
MEASLAMLKTLVAARIRRYGRRAYAAQCAVSQMGRTLRAMGRAAEACELHWTVLSIRHEVYGFELYTSNSAGILADTLKMLADEEMAAAVRFWAHRPENPSTNDLASIKRVDDRLKRTRAEHDASIHHEVTLLIRAYLK